MEPNKVSIRDRTQWPSSLRRVYNLNLIMRKCQMTPEFKTLHKINGL